MTERSHQALRTPLQAMAAPAPILAEISGPRGPSDAQLVTTGIVNFWRANDAGATASTFQTEYLDHASSGLQEFISKRSLTAVSLAQMAQAYPRYFAAVRSKHGGPGDEPGSS